jgi:murein DD-endopeptidase MepM/ murein hydrolase activator NlpD
MSNSFKRILTIFAAFAIIFSIGAVVYANEIRELQERRQAAQNSVQEQRELLRQAQAERNDTLAEILLMDIELTEITNQYLDARLELEEATLLLAMAEDNLARAEIDREAQYEMLRNRIRFMHENNSVTYIELLFASDSIADFLNNIEHISRIIEHDRDILENLMETEARIAHNHILVAQYHAEVAQLNIDLEARIVELEAGMAARAQRVDQLAYDEAHHSALADIFEQEVRDVALLILNAEAAAEAARRASQAAATRNHSVSVAPDAIMHWPVDGPRGVNSGYGVRRHPISGRTEMHTGIDLLARMNTPILAAADGIVTQSQYRRGYGNTVIISHGGGLSTLYAHNSRNIVNVGDWVEQGDLIALAGSTGLSTGPHLHFEIRVNNRPVDPMLYFPD